MIFFLIARVYKIKHLQYAFFCVKVYTVTFNQKLKFMALLFFCFECYVTDIEEVLVNYFVM
jgi:hypothetical protein